MTRQYSRLFWTNTSKMLEDLSQHILDIAENGVNAGADSISVKIDDGLKKSC